MADFPVVLVVEDEPLIQQLVTEALNDAGFETRTASSGPAAVALLEQDGDALQALVTDINLGGDIEGWDVARRARELFPEFPVVYMTGREGADWSSKGVPNSILVSKPFAPAQIVTAISQLLNAGAAPT